jgi:hypothetical protein
VQPLVLVWLTAQSRVSSLEPLLVVVVVAQQGCSRLGLLSHVWRRAHPVSPLKLRPVPPDVQDCGKHGVCVFFYLRLFLLRYRPVRLAYFQ